jgi:hypothetical protein
VAGWSPETVWTGHENLVLAGIRYEDRPARSQSLYTLSYHGPDTIKKNLNPVHNLANHSLMYRQPSQLILFTFSISEKKFYVNVLHYLPLTPKYI